MKTRLFAAFIFLSFAGTAAQASVYNCSSNGKSVYTSDPSGSCTGADLPKISSHQGGGYRLKIKNSVKKPKYTRKTKRKAKNLPGKRTGRLPKPRKKIKRKQAERKARKMPKNP
ncbi:hypothetical protein NEILACOT_04888 [Neisseria lactamica ATCC 23970]|uniref:DUF4124 domain-containing protein n=1 Tax=Neisseria lactamica ATCC 23970 TaxID=546265 RepID=D0WBG2_NEILA|nr:hypothetical protein NEILACOT_04888 [Neisseria lactamica ATCC 23970]